MAAKAKRKTQLSYAEDWAAATRYRRLQPSGVNLKVKLGKSDDVITLEGVNPSVTVSQIKDMIFDSAGIHPCRQRIFLGGCDVQSDENLLEYFQTSHDVNTRCCLQLRCFIPLLISTTTCPGPLLTEVEVAPLNNEPVAEVKRRIRDKFRIETTKQRLHLHPDAMTTFSRRLPLGDARLLSSYLDPGANDNFLELIVVDDTKSAKLVLLKIPLKVLVAYNFGDSSGDDNDDNAYDAKESNQPVTPPTPPQTPASGSSQLNVQQYIEQVNKSQPRYETWWFTLPVSYDAIIKRDPLVKDMSSLVTKTLLQHPLLKDKQGDLALKFVPVRRLFGGEVLDPDGPIYDVYGVRSEEMLMHVEDLELDARIKSPPRLGLADNLESAQCQPKLMEPLKPLVSYNEATNLHTTPFDPCRFVWKVPASGPIDCGAMPSSTFEVSAVSYCRAYGSWDIPEHAKTYVEIDVEGSCDVGDLGLEAVVGRDTSRTLGQDYDVDVMFDKQQRQVFGDYNGDGNLVYYVHHTFEVTILGPVNAGTRARESQRPSVPYLGEETRVWPFERRRRSTALEKMRMGQRGSPVLLNPPPLRIKPPENCVLKTTQVDNDPINPSWDEGRDLSKINVNEWYLDRERVSDVMLPGMRRGVTSSSGAGVSAFTNACRRGVSVEGRPYVAFQFKRQLGIVTTSRIVNPNNNLMDSIRKSLDFRIQAQFYICHLVADPKPPAEKSPFTVRVRHLVTRVDHVVDQPDHVTHFESPEVGMETTLNVALATSAWRKSKGLPLPETEDLNR